MKLENFTKDELIAAMRGLGRESLIKDWEAYAIRFGLEKRLDRLRDERQRLFKINTDTLRQIEAENKKYAGIPLKDIPIEHFDLQLSLNDKFEKEHKRQSDIRKRESECWKQYHTAIYCNTNTPCGTVPHGNVKEKYNGKQ